MDVNKLGILLFRFSENAYTFTVPQLMRFALVFTGIMLLSLVILQRLFVLIVLVLVFIMLLVVLLVMSGANLKNLRQYRRTSEQSDYSDYEHDSGDDKIDVERSVRDFNNVKINKKKLQEFRKKLKDCSKPLGRDNGAVSST